MKGITVYLLNRVDQLTDGQMYIHTMYLYSNRQSAEKHCARLNKAGRANVVLHHYPEYQHRFDGYVRADEKKKAIWFYVSMETVQ